MDVVTAISSVIPRRHVTSLGNFRSATVYLVELDSAAAHAALLAAAEFRVNGHTAAVLPATPGQLTLILRRLPQSVPDRFVEVALRPWCVVIRQHRLRFDDPGLTGVVTDRRQVLVTLRHGIASDSVPATLRVADLDVTVDVMGRPTRCFRCQQLGHSRKGCPVPDCSICSRPDVRGHRCVPTRRPQAVPPVLPLPSPTSVPDADCGVAPVPVMHGVRSGDDSAAVSNDPAVTAAAVTPITSSLPAPTVAPPPGFPTPLSCDDARGARSRGSAPTGRPPPNTASCSDASISPPRTRVRTRSRRRRSPPGGPAGLSVPSNPDCSMDCTRPVSPARHPSLGTVALDCINPFDVLSALTDARYGDSDTALQ